MHKAILCRIGWMTYYEGPKPDDPKPKGGGSYNVKHTGLEAYNFKKINKQFFGYVTAPGYKLNLRRIDPIVKKNTIHNGLVIFIATKPKKGGQVVIGWYKNAKLFDVEQEGNTGQRDNFRYNIVASIKDAVLLPTYLRTFKVPAGTGGIGQANVAYVLDDYGNKKNLPWLKSLLNYVDTYDGLNLVNNHEAEYNERIEAVLEGEGKQTGQGFLISSGVRKAVENRAMDVAKAHYQQKKFKVKDVSKKESYDLFCSKGKHVIYVEVKGSQRECNKIILTPREVKHARKYMKNSVLFIQYNIKIKKRGRSAHGFDGKHKIVYPWKIINSNLKPFIYIYEL